MNHAQAIDPAGIKRPIGPYSNGLLAPPGRLLAIAGQSGVVEDTTSPPDAAAQADVIFRNIRTIVEAAGGSMSDLVSLTIYLRDATSYAAVNDARKRHLAAPYPASATVTGIGFLTPGMAVEISALAVIAGAAP
ncbi:RidA family protein [Variovorax sp. KK3]|uniref:RidA family protein n=1 Tax=Variovorax sp. KK3 TaxID=1855728 RepID=UPI00097BCF88|nr:RidA family protein [Variovorax sp. KK3]